MPVRRRPAQLGIVALLVLAIAPSEGIAEPPAPELDNKNYFNLRVGASTSNNNERASICLEVSIWRQLSVEGCGNGSGILHNDDGGELAHFRAKWAAWRAPVSSGEFILQGGLGFAELAVGADEPGFEFGDPAGESAAGPEAALSMQYLAPFGRGFEFIASSAVGLAYIRGARGLPTAPSRAQPFASFELGIGW